MPITVTLEYRTESACEAVKLGQDIFDNGMFKRNVT